MYMTLEGIYGTAVDVSATLIILFTIFGAFLQFTGAGKFFIDFSFAAMGGKPTGAGRTVVMASFLLGGPSGSGVATTVTLGSAASSFLAIACQMLWFLGIYVLTTMLVPVMSRNDVSMSANSIRAPVPVPASFLLFAK